MSKEIQLASRVEITGFAAVGFVGAILATIARTPENSPEAGAEEINRQGHDQSSAPLPFYRRPQPVVSFQPELFAEMLDDGHTSAGWRERLIEAI